MEYRLAISRGSARARRRGTASFFLAVALVVLTAGAAGAQRINIPIGVGINAYVNKKPDGVVTEYDWVVSQKRTEIRLFIQKLTVKTGQVSANDIDNAVNPYPVNFQIAGEDAAVRALLDAPEGSRVDIDAYLQFGEGARYMMLNKVSPLAAPTAPPAAATP